MRSGAIQVPKDVIVAPNPVCAACHYGKAHRRTHHSSTGTIGKEHDFPGAGVSADQLEAGCPGLLPTTKGSPTTQRYKYCNVWVDHYSRFVYVTMHSTKEAKEMLSSKLEYESFCRKHGVTIKSIRADNGIYASQLFRASCDSQSQTLSFCAVGSHWQNGIAERCINTIQTVARTILLHAQSHWPSVITEQFWPFAIHHAVNLYNPSTRIGEEVSPWERFTGEATTGNLADYHVFGSPVYVLHKTLQDHPGSLSKWKSRCWQGVYLGHSPLHAGNVALVYNPVTGHISPQFHVSFDDSFSSVLANTTTGDSIIESILSRNTWLYTDKFAPPTAHHYFCTDATTHEASDAMSNESGPKYKPVQSSPAFQSWKQEQGIAAEVFAPFMPSQQRPLGSTQDSLPKGAPLETPQNPSAEAVSQAIPLLPQPEGALSHATQSLDLPQPEVLVPVMLASALDPKQRHSASEVSPVFTVPPPLGDSLTQSSMLRATDLLEFVKAQVLEINSLHASGVFSYHPIASLPPKAKLLNAIWSYRRKRTPAGVLKKHKARICTDGSQQQYGVDYWETYAPVVSWSTVRLLLTLASIHGWKSSQIDFAQAFTQPPIAEDVYMRIPQGFYVADGNLHQHADPRYPDHHYIKLEKSLYGIKQAARAWFHYLEPGLIKLGFKASPVDPCLFYRDDCIVALYVDDCLLFSPSQSVINVVVSTLRQDYEIGDQGSVQDFLGVNIRVDDTGSTHFTQPALIQSILSDLNLADCHRKFTPAISVLHPDHGGYARSESWNYRSLIGKLNYLAQMTRPDISMAVHNCARFSISPTSLHEQAVKRIGRYLSTTSSHGLIYRPDSTSGLDMYVDADFAGAWHKEFSQLRECVLSRTGFVILYHNCPIHWGSKLQTEIALSTTEAEYIALSTAARELIPLRRLLRELTQFSPLRNHNTSLPSNLPPSIIYEDNAACLAIATKDSHHKPRTKHMAIKYHHFRDYVKSGALSIVKVPTRSNLADIFTKPLTQALHEHLRLGLMGW
jgi:hypothetical protein